MPFTHEPRESAGQAARTTISETDTHWARIYIAGPVQEVERICRDFCLDVGLCVTVTPTSYIYTGGQEAGVVVGLINYPRFPSSSAEIDAKAEALGIRLLIGLAQLSFSVETPQRTRWFSRRQEAPTDSEPARKGDQRG